MNEGLSVLKGIARPTAQFLRNSRVVRNHKIRSLKKKLLSELENYIGGYVFSDIDVDLYAIERYTRLPVHTVEDTDDPGLISVTIANKKIFWPADLPVGDLGWLYHEIFDDFVVNPSSYDWPQLDYANRNWFIDAGAAEGYFSIFALEKSPQALIVCLEPLRLLRKSLERTLGMYENETRAIVVSSALGASPGQATFQVDYDHISDSGILPSGAGAPLDLENRTMETVDVTTLDQLAEKYSLGSGGLIKMDIEGFEMAALGGAAKVLKNYKPALAIAVYHEHDNARKCAEIILAANPSYNVIFRGCYGYFDPPRPYMLFAV